MKTTVLLAVMLVTGSAYLLGPDLLTTASIPPSECQRLFADPAALKSELDTLLITCGQAAEETQNPDHQYIYAYLLAFTGDHKEAIPWLKKAAVSDHVKAQHLLARFYFEGHGLQPDTDQALQWYEKAAAQDHAEAQYFLAMFLRNGIATERDPEKALVWFKKAAQQENNKAQYFLANEYYFGKVITKDFNQALYWMQKAADNGHPAAQKGLFNEALCSD